MPPIIFFSQKPKATTRMSSRQRQRPLHACGVSIFAIADIALGKTQHINGPLGSTLRKMANLAKFATPLIYAMQYQWLAILSFIDGIILAAEKMTEKLFPPSTYVFNKIDEVVLMIMSLPENFDGAVNKLPAIILSRLNSFPCTWNHWRQENSRVNEKTIGVDRNCNEQLESASGGYLNVDGINSESMESFPPIPEAENKGVHDLAVSGHVKGSYKEALERGKEEKSSDDKIEKKIDGGDDECEVNEIREKNDDGNNEECKSTMKYQVGRSESIPLLELFESAWLMKPGRY